MHIGLYLADASVWIACAMVLAAFDIKKVDDVVPEFTSGTLRCVIPCLVDSSC